MPRIETSTVATRGSGKPDYSKELALSGSALRITSAQPLPVDGTFAPGAKVATTILDEASIAAGATTALADCDAIDLSSGPPTLAITIEATYHASATRGIKIHIRTSYDNTNYDDEDWDSWIAAFTAGSSKRQTKHYDIDPMYMKVLIENLDGAQAVSSVKVISVIRS